MRRIPSQTLICLVIVLCGISVPISLALAQVTVSSSGKGMHRVLVKAVVLDSRSKQPVVVLQDKSPEGWMIPIWIGIAEAHAIMMQLRGVTPKRPMTHDLLGNIIGGLKVKVVRIIISDFRGGTYYAHIEMKSPNRNFYIDSRPSDAIALALRVKAPIFAKAHVLQDGGFRATDSKLTHSDLLGVVFQSMTPSLAPYFGSGLEGGLLVSQIFSGKLAESSGLRRGDVIIQVEGRKVSTVESFEREFLEQGRDLDISVRRGPDGKYVRLRIGLANSESARRKR